MVGDMKQSIYRFRLAEPGLFLDKYRRFSNEPGQEEREDGRSLIWPEFPQQAGSGECGEYGLPADHGQQCRGD